MDDMTDQLRDYTKAKLELEALGLDDPRIQSTSTKDDTEETRSGLVQRSGSNTNGSSCRTRGYDIFD